MTAPAALLSGGANISFATASTTSFYGMTGGFGNYNINESRAQHQVGTPGTLSGLSVSVFTNNRTNNTTYKARNNGADAGSPSTMQAVFGSGVTGVITDTSNTVALVLDDRINMAITTGTGTQTIFMATNAVVFTANTGTSTFIASQDGTGTGLSGTGPITDFVAFAGVPSNTVTEANAQVNVPVAGTAQHLTLSVSANGRSTATPVTLRKNGANGSNTFTYNAAQTGSKTDTTHSDAISAGDLLTVSPVLGTGTGNFQINLCGITFDATSDGSSFVANGAAVGVSAAAGANSFYMLGGVLVLNLTNENRTQAATGVSSTGSKAWIFVSANASTTAPALHFRQTASDRNQNVTITALTTGAFQDTTNSDAFTAAQLVNWRLANITTSTITVNGISMQMRTPFTAAQAAQASSSSVASLKRSTGKPLNASSSAVAALVRQAGKLLQASSASVASSSRQLAISKSFQASSVVVASLVRQTGKAFQATSVAIASRTNQVGKALQASSSALASASRQTGKALQASSSASVSATKAIALSRQAASSSVGDMSFQLGKGLAAESFSVASLSVQTGKFLQASSSAVASLVRSIGKLLQATSAAIASATAVKHSSGITAQASSESVASLTKSFPRALQASSSPVATLVRQIGKLLQASSAAVASLSRSTALFFQASSPSVATAAKTIPQSMQAASNAIATLTLRFGKGVVNRARLLGTRFQAGLEATKTVAQLVGQRVQASLSGTRSDPNLEGTKTQPTLKGEVDE